MLGLLLAAVCVCSRAATLAPSLLKDRTDAPSGDPFSNSSSHTLTSHTLTTAQTSAQEEESLPWDLTTPLRDLTTPLRDLTTPLRDLTTPLRDLTTPPRDLSPPQRDLTPPLRDLTMPPRDLSPPLRDLTPPLRDLTTPLRDLSPPLRDLTPPLRDLSPPLRDLTTPLRDLSPPLRDLTTPLRDLTTPLRDLTTPLRDLTSADPSGPRPDAAETWTEAAHPRAEDASVLPSSPEVTEATMSSEDLPLIFEPFEDISAPASGTPGDSELMLHTSSDVRVSGTPESRASTTHSDPAQQQRHTGDDVTRSSVSEDQESKEGPEEEEEEEMDSDEEEEEESEEDLMESTMAPPTRPPYSLIPPPPVWVQRNQGLVRSWVELIREKAGYVSGMLAPVGIGIAGALLLVGALYSIRLIHRKRRHSFKHQRRKPPREVRSGPDNAMLLADSSEDEF